MPRPDRSKVKAVVKVKMESKIRPNTVREKLSE